MNEVTFFRKQGYFKTPRVLQIELTTRCPLNCPQCYKGSTDSEDIDFEYLKRLLTQQRKYGLNSVMLNGGEPLLYPHFFELIDYLEQLNVFGNCFTSGITINEEKVYQIKKYKHLFLNISLNGSSYEINSKSRDGHYQTIKAIKLLKDADAVYGINWVARKDNVSDFKNIIKFAEENKASNILIVGNKYTCAGKMDSPMDYKDLVYLNDIITDYRKNTGTIQIVIQQCFTELKELQGESNVQINSGCPAGRIFCAVDHNGQFLPCTHILRRESFENVNEYWKHSKQLDNIRKMTLNSIHPLCSDEIAQIN